MRYTNHITLTDHVDLYERTKGKMKTQPLTETQNLPRWWNNKTKLQVLNVDNEPPNARPVGELHQLPESPQKRCSIGGDIIGGRDDASVLRDNGVLTHKSGSFEEVYQDFTFWELNSIFFSVSACDDVDEEVTDTVTQSGSSSSPHRRSTSSTVVNNAHFFFDSSFFFVVVLFLS